MGVVVKDHKCWRRSIEDDAVPYRNHRVRKVHTHRCKLEVR